MKILPVGNVTYRCSANKKAPEFKANLVITQEAKNQASKHICRNDNKIYLLFYDSMHKFNKRLKGEYPLGGDVIFDSIKPNTKKNIPKNSVSGQKSDYEIRINNKAIDFHFDFDGIFSNKNYYEKTEAEAINIESSKQAENMYNTYVALRSSLYSKK